MWKNTKTPNLDPVIYQGGRVLMNWLGYCLAYVQTAFGAGWAGATAWDGWSSVQGKHADRSFPVGVYVPIWFSHTGTYGGVRKNWGHVAILKVEANGSAKIWSSPLSNKPYADVFTSISQVESAFGASFVGWSEFVGPTRVLEYKPTVTDAQIRQAYLEILERPADANGLSHYRTQVSKGWTLSQIRNDLLTSQERKTMLANKEKARKAEEEARRKAEEARIKAEQANQVGEQPDTQETPKNDEAYENIDKKLDGILGLLQSIWEMLTRVFK